MTTLALRDILRKTAYRPIDVENLLDPNQPSWVRFDPELGYLPDSITMQDGMDHSWTRYGYPPAGHRKVVNYADAPCRIHTYGNSYTQCQQVSDGETWQEQLAAHLGEPVRNYGNGGIGVYQSCRRMQREEPKSPDADHVILNVFVDDHIRNLDAARWVRTAWDEKERPADKAYPLHGLPWVHLRYNLETGDFEECPALCQNAEDLRALCDVDRFVATFEQDEIVQLFAIQQGLEVEDLTHFYALAKAFDVQVDLEDPEKRARDAMKLHQLYGQHSSIWLLEKMRRWLEERNKKLFLILSYCMGTLNEYLTEGKQMDTFFLDYVARSGLPWVSLAEAHKKDFVDFNLTVPQYQERFYVMAREAAVFGHYNPTGNHFTTFAVKDAVVDWLEPKPPAYRSPA